MANKEALVKVMCQGNTRLYFLTNEGFEVGWSMVNDKKMPSDLGISLTTAVFILGVLEIQMAQLVEDIGRLKGSYLDAARITGELKIGANDGDSDR